MSVKLYTAFSKAKGKWKMGKNLLLWLIYLIGISSRIVAQSAAGPVEVRYPLSPEYMDENNISLSFCKENNGLLPPRNIHNGIDIPVPATQPVFSLCDGRLIYDNTSAGYWDSFLIIKHDCNGKVFYAYYGHVLNAIRNPADIKGGEKIATIRHDASGKIGDHLHLSVSVGADWDRHGWGYDVSCESIKAEAYVDPMKYLKFTGSEPPPDPDPPALPNKKFDVKTSLAEKQKLTAAKAGLIAYIYHSGWAQVVEFGEDNSVWLKNYRRESPGDASRVQLDFEIRRPAMLRQGELISAENFKLELPEPSSYNITDIEDSQLDELIEAQLAESGLPRMYRREILNTMSTLLKQVRNRRPSPYEALEGMVFGAILLKTLENKFARSDMD